MFEYDIYDGHNIVQGGTFDGTYYYVATINNKVVPETTYITKYDATGKLVARSPKLKLDHANDITYVKKWNALVVSHCQPASTVKDDDQAYYRYSLVNPNTFAILQTAEKTKPFFGMDYSVSRDAFVSARWGGQTFDFWDGKMNPVKKVDVDPPKGTSQGIACDEQYVYCARYNPNLVNVYDWDAKLLFEISLQSDGGEPEHLSCVDGVLYIGGSLKGWTGGYFGYVELEEIA